MHTVKVMRQSPFTAQQMFALICDVDSYDEFIPYCTAARTRNRTETEMLGDLAIGYKFLRETYTSKITMAHDPLTVTVAQQKGPFRHLFNQWVFEDAETGSEVHFELQFDFAVPMLRKLIAPMMDRVVEKFIDAFEQRALEIYK